MSSFKDQLTNSLKNPERNKAPSQPQTPTNKPATKPATSSGAPHRPGYKPFQPTKPGSSYGALGQDPKFAGIKPNTKDPDFKGLLTYNNPTEINSVLDVIFNTKALDTNYGSHGFAARIKAYNDFQYNAFIKPILTGNSAVLITNALQSLGETVDVADNIIKSQTTVLLGRLENNRADMVDYDLALEIVNKVRTGQARMDIDYTYTPVGERRFTVQTSKGTQVWYDKEYKIIEEIVNSGRTVNPYNLTWDERLKSAVGWGDYGRINYDYNTGNQMTNMMYEVVTGMWDKGVKAIANAASDVGATIATKGLKNVAAQNLDLFKLNPNSFDGVKRLAIAEDAFDLYRAGKVVADNTPDKQLLSTITNVAVKSAGVEQDFALKTLGSAMTYSLAKAGIINTDPQSLRYMRDLLDRATAFRVNKMTTGALTKGVDFLVGATDPITKATIKGGVLDGATKALLRANFAPAGIYHLGKLLEQSPSLARWEGNLMAQVGKANSTDGVLTIEALTDNLHAMERVKRTISDATGMPVENIPDVLSIFDSIKKDTTVFTDIITRTTKDNVAQQLKALSDYLAKAHPTVDLDVLITKAQKFYFDNPDAISEYYVKLLRRVKDYQTVNNKYLKAVKDSGAQITMDLLTNIEDTVADATKAADDIFINDLQQLATNVPKGFDPPELRHHFNALVYNVNTNSLKKLKLTDPNNSAIIELVQPELQASIKRYSDNLLNIFNSHLENDVLKLKVHKATETFATDLMAVADHIKTEMPELPKWYSTPLPTIKKLVDGSLSAYNTPKEFVELLKRTGNAVEIAETPDALADSVIEQLRQGQFDVAYVKLENASTVDCLNQSPAFQALSEQFGISGAIGVVVNKISQMPDLSADVKRHLEVLRTATAAPDAYMQLLAKLQGMPGFTPEKLEAIKQELQHYVSYSKDGAYLHPQDFAQKVAHGANNFLGAQQQTKFYTVDAFLQENLDEVNAVRKTLGLAEITAEEHTALSDAIIEYVMYKKCLDKYPELQGKKFGVLDLEAANTKTGSSKNTISQVGLFGDGVQNEHSLTADFMSKNSEAYVPSEQFMRAQLNDQTSDYKTLVNKWINTRYSTGAEESEEMLITAALNDIYNQARETWNPDTKSYDFVLAAHNGNAFDYALLRNKVQAYLSAGGLTHAIDPHILDKITLADTLEMWHRADGWNVIEDSDIPFIQQALFDYIRTVKDMPDPMFSSITEIKLIEMSAALDFLKEQGGVITDDLYNNAMNIIDNMRATLNSVADSNTALSKYAINLEKLTENLKEHKEVFDYLVAHGVDPETFDAKLAYATQHGHVNFSALMYAVTRTDAPKIITVPEYKDVVRYVPGDQIAAYVPKLGTPAVDLSPTETVSPFQWIDKSVPMDIPTKLVDSKNLEIADNTNKLLDVTDEEVEFYISIGQADWLDPDTVTPAVIKIILKQNSQKPALASGASLSESTVAHLSDLVQRLTKAGVDVPKLPAPMQNAINIYLGTPKSYLGMAPDSIAQEGKLLTAALVENFNNGPEAAKALYYKYATPPMASKEFLDKLKDFEMYHYRGRQRLALDFKDYVDKIKDNPDAIATAKSFGVSRINVFTFVDILEQIRKNPDYVVGVPDLKKRAHIATLLENEKQWLADNAKHNTDTLTTQNVVLGAVPKPVTPLLKPKIVAPDYTKTGAKTVPNLIKFGDPTVIEKPGHMTTDRVLTGTKAMQVAPTATGDTLNHIGWKTEFRSQELNEVFAVEDYGKLSVTELEQMYQFAKRVMQSGNNPDILTLTADSVASIKTVLERVSDILATPTERLSKPAQHLKIILQKMPYIKHLDTSINDPQKLGAIFKQLIGPMYNNVSDVVDTVLFDELPATATLKAMLTKQPGVDPLERWINEDFGGRYDILTSYAGISRDFQNMQVGIGEVSADLERLGLAGASVQARTAAMTPGFNLAHKMKTICNSLSTKGYDKLTDTYDPKVQQQVLDSFSRGLVDMRQQAGKRAARAVFEDPANVVRNLCSAGGIIIFEDPEIFKGLDVGALAKQNVKAVDLGNNQFAIYLTKDSKFTQRLADTGKGIEEVVYTIEDTSGTITELTRSDWAVDLFDGLEDDLADSGLVELIGVKDLKELMQSAAAASKSNAFISSGAAAGTTFERCNIDTLNRVRQLLPESIQKDLADLPNPIIFQNNGYNHTVLGSANLVKAWTGANSDDPIKMLCKSVMDNAQTANTVTTYATAMLSDKTVLAGTPLGNALIGDPANAIRWLNKHDEYVLASLVPSKNQYGFEVHKFSAKEVERAVRSGAHLLPANVYDKLYKVINTSATSNTFVKIWSTLEHMYKVGYLINPSTAIRNTLDTIIKTSVDSKTAPTAVLREYARAVKIYSDFDQVTKQLLKFLPPDATFGGFIKSDAVRDFFKANRFALDYDAYLYYYKFLQESAAGGEIATLSKFTTQQRIEYLRALESTKVGGSSAVRQAQMAMHTDKLFGTALWGMNYTESIARLAQLNLNVKQHKTFTEAVQAISRTQFNYDNKTPFERKMEFLIPFYTFANRNLTFWLDACDSNPGFLNRFRDVLAPIWDLNQYDPYELENNRSLQYNVLAGNIMLGNDTVLKTNFSFMDAMHWFLDPLKTAKESVYFPVQAVIDASLQGLSDASYHSGNEVLSNWVQHYFGTLPTRQQIDDKYGEWAQEYLDTYHKKLSSESFTKTLLDKFATWQAVPLIGTIINRFQKTTIYYAEDPIKAAGLERLNPAIWLKNHLNALTSHPAEAIGHTLGLTGPVKRFKEEEQYDRRQKTYFKLSGMLETDVANSRQLWAELCEIYGVDPNANIYAIDYHTMEKMSKDFAKEYERTTKDIYQKLQEDEEYIFQFSWYKAQMGYADVKLADLPYDVRDTIDRLLRGEEVLDPRYKDLAEAYAAHERDYEVKGELFNLITNDTDTMYMYTRLKWALGYGNTSLKELPPEVRSALLEILTDPTPDVSILPVIQDNETVLTFWKRAEAEHGLTNVPFDKIPTPVLNEIYQEIAQSCVTITKIHELLETDLVARHSYNVARDKLGYGDLKLNQLPNDVLELILYDMENHTYLPPVRRPWVDYSGRRRRGASRSPARRRTGSYYPGSYHPGMTPHQINFQYNKIQWPNYAHNNAHKSRHRIYEKQYINNVRAPGVTNKIKNNVNNKISPTELKYRIKDMYHYFH